MVAYRRPPRNETHVYRTCERCRHNREREGSRILAPHPHLSHYKPETIAMGASIACSGPCLTVVGFGVHGDGAWFEIDAARETLERTTVGTWQAGSKVNLERSLKIGDELGGHLVSGHVDGVAGSCCRRSGHKRSGRRTGCHCAIHDPRSEAACQIHRRKGSVALDGTSLTVNTVSGQDFTVLLIPHTLQVTTWGSVKAGDHLNIEVDQMARYAAAACGSTRRGLGKGRSVLFQIGCPMAEPRQACIFARTARRRAYSHC